MAPGCKQAGQGSQRYHPKRCERQEYVVSYQRLALGELEPLASALLPVLLTFVRSGVASEEPKLLESAAQFGVELDQGASDAQPRRASLACEPAAAGQDQNIEFIRHLCRQQGLTHDIASGLVHKVVFECPAVHLNLALAGTKKICVRPTSYAGRLPNVEPNLPLFLAYQTVNANGF